MPGSQVEWKWPVVPMSPGQLLDVRAEDLVEGGAYRLCSTYRGGGGYDKFPAIAEQRGLGPGHDRQFVVQLRGCHLDCPYCYVTRAGVWGAPVLRTSKELVAAFNRVEASVFHLMGGSPALYIDRWPELLDELAAAGKPGHVFHSDLLLTEKVYLFDTLTRLAKPGILLAVDVKGLDDGEYRRNTRKDPAWGRFWENLVRLDNLLVPYYVTFTNCSTPLIDKFWEKFAGCCSFEGYAAQRRDSFSISIIQYAAMAHVDDAPWGGQGGPSVGQPRSGDG